MMPEFSTPGATRPTRPASAAVMLPRLITEALGLVEAMSKFSLPPAMNWACACADMTAVVTTMAPTLTLAVAPNTTPLGLVMITVPLETIWPRICDAPAPRIWFKAESRLLA